MFYGKTLRLFIISYNSLSQKRYQCYRLIPLTYIYEMKQHMSNLHLVHYRSIFIWILFYDYENSDGHQFNLYQQKRTPLKQNQYDQT